MSVGKPLVMLVGRVLISVMFVLAGLNKLMDYEHTAAYMASKHMPNIPILLYGAAAIEVLCGLSVLLGFWARGAALILALFLVPVTLIFHDFWNVTKPEDLQFQMSHFFMNWAVVGGLLYIVCFGSGLWSVRRIK